MKLILLPDMRAMKQNRILLPHRLHRDEWRGYSCCYSGKSGFKRIFLLIFLFLNCVAISGQQTTSHCFKFDTHPSSGTLNKITITVFYPGGSSEVFNPSFTYYDNCYDYYDNCDNDCINQYLSEHGDSPDTYAQAKDECCTKTTWCYKHFKGQISTPKQPETVIVEVWASSAHYRIRYELKENKPGSLNVPHYEIGSSSGFIFIWFNPITITKGIQNKTAQTLPILNNDWASGYGTNKNFYLFNNSKKLFFASYISSTESSVAASDLADYPSFLDKSIDFQFEQSNTPCGTFNSNIISHTFYGKPKLTVDNGGLVCESASIPLHCSYEYDPSGEYLDIGAKLEYSADNVTFSDIKDVSSLLVNATTSLSFSNISDDRSLLGKQIYIRPYKVYGGVKFTGDTRVVVFLPVIKNVEITPHPPTCAESDDASFKLTFTDVPETGLKNPGGNNIPLIITIEQYSEFKLADDVTYKTQIFDGKIYYYRDGATTILKDIDIKDKNWITIDNKSINSTFKLVAGKYVINVKLNNEVASCGATLFKDFVTPFPFKTSAIAQSILIKDGTTYHVRTGDNNARVKFTFEGGTPPYTVKSTNASGATLATYTQAGEYYLDVVTDQASETKRSYYLADKNTCKGSGSYDVTFYRPQDVTFSNSSSTSVDCNQSDESGTKNNGTVKVTVSGGIPGYAAELWAGNQKLQNKSVPTAGEVSFSGDPSNPIPTGKYQVKIKDNLNTDKVWASSEISVGEPDPLTINVSPTNPTCDYNSDGSLVLTPGGGNGNYAFTVKKDNVSITNYSHVLSAGFYSITVADSKTCTKSTTEMLVNPSPLQLIATYIKPASCARVNNGSVKAMVSNYRNAYTEVVFTDSQNRELPASYKSADNSFEIAGLNDNPGMKIIVHDRFCQASDTAKIPLRAPALAVETRVTANAPCTGKNGEISVTALNGELPSGSKYKYSVDGGSPIEQITTTQSFRLAGGTRHVFVVEDGEGCAASQEDVVQVRADSLKLKLVDNITAAWCSGSNSGQIVVQKLAGTGMTDFRLIPTGLVKQDLSQVTFTNLYPRTYTISASDVYGCTDVAMVAVPVRGDSIALASFNTIRAVCKESSPTGALKVSHYVNGKKTGYGTINYALGAKVQTDTVFAGLRSGWYTVTANDAMGCRASVSDSVKFDENPVRLDTLFVTHQTCNEVQKAKIKLIASTKPGTENLYRFVYGQDTTAWRQDTITYSLKTAGTYTFRVMDKNNCGTSMTEAVKNLKYAPKPLLDYSSPVACANAQNGELSVYNRSNNSRPKYCYVLGQDIVYTGSSTERAIFPGLQKGVHLITVRDTLGCQDTARFTVNVESDSVRITRISTSPASCIVAQNGKAKVVSSSFDKGNSSNKYTFECNGKLLQGDSVIFTGLPVSKPGFYFVKVSDKYGCQNSDNFGIDVKKDTLTIDPRASGDAACPGSSDGWIKVRRNFGNERFRYQLSSNGGFLRKFDSNDTLVFMNSLPFGRYSVSVTDTNQCFARIGNIVISQPDTIRFLSYYHNYVKRKGQPEGAMSASIWSGNGKYNYEWYNVGDNSLVARGQASQNKLIELTGRYAGKYLLRVRDTANCFVNPTGWLEKQFTIVEPEKALELKLTRNKAVSCHGLSDGEFSVKATGGWGENYLYGLDAEHLDISGQFTGLGADTLAAFAKDTSGVVVSIPVIITQPDSLRVSFQEKTDANCFGSSDGQIKVNISGGNYPHYFVSTDRVHWEKGSVILGLPKGSYPIYVRDTLRCSNSLLSQVTIGQPTEIRVLKSKTTDTRCRYANGSIVAEIEGGNPSYAFQWNDENDKVVPGEGSNAYNLYSGTYRLGVTDNHHCTRVFPFNVSDITDLTIDRVDTTDVSCWGYSDGKASVYISKGNPPYTITWPDNSHDSSISGLVSGKYSVRVDDKERCKVFRNFTIGTPSQVLLESVTTTHPYCEGVEDGKITANATGGFGGYSYLWSTGKEGNSISKLSPGRYRLSITDSHRCFNNFDFTLAYQQTIKPSLGHDRNLCNGNSLVLSPGEYFSYKWGANTGLSSFEPRITVKSAGNYYVEVADFVGCIGRDSIKVGLSATAMEGRLLVATNVGQNDTVVLFQASYPFPDSVKFSLEGCRIIETGKYYQKVVFADTGTFAIGLTSYLNDCEDKVTKTVHVESVSKKQQKFVYRLIQAFNVTPNPSNGAFNVEVQLREPAAIVMRLANLGTGVISDVRTYKGSETYYCPYNLSLPPGMYMLHLQCGNEAKSKTLILIR